MSINHTGLELTTEQEEALELTLVNVLSSDLPASAGFFTSIPMVTEEDKALVFNMLSGETLHLRDEVNKQIKVTDIMCHTIQVTDQATGELKTAPRIILIAENGTPYTCVSLGVATAMNRILDIYGKPPWKPALIVEPFEVKGSNSTNRVLTLKLHPRVL